MNSKYISILLSGFIACGSVGASNIFHTDFGLADYSPGDLNGQRGWTVTHADQVNIIGEGLNYSSGAVSHSGGAQKLQLLGGSEARASMGLEEPFASGSTFYFSYLFQQVSGNDFTWFAFSDSAAGGDNSSLGVAVTSGRFFTRARDTGGNQQAIDSEVSLGTEMRLLVGRIDFQEGGDSTIHLIVDPASLTEPTTWNAVSSRNIGATQIDTVWVRKGGMQGEAFIDSIRVGTSYDMVVIPETSSLAMVLGSIAAMAVIFRRRVNRK